MNYVLKNSPRFSALWKKIFQTIPMSLIFIPLGRRFFKRDRQIIHCSIHIQYNFIFSTRKKINLFVSKNHPIEKIFWLEVCKIHHTDRNKPCRKISLTLHYLQTSTVIYFHLFRPKNGFTVFSSIYKKKKKEKEKGEKASGHNSIRKEK